MINILNELNSRQIANHVYDLLRAAGCKVSDMYNSMKTTKGKTASRQLTVHADIESPSGNKYRVKFDPDCKQAIPRRGYRFIPYDPKIHKEEKLYVRVPVTDHTGNYDPDYNVYVEMTNNPTITTDLSQPMFIGQVHSANDFTRLMSRVDSNY